MADLQKRLLSDIDLKPYIWWRYISIYCAVALIHATVKLTADWSYSSINVLEVKVILNDRNIITDLYVKPTDTHRYLASSSCHPYHCKKVSLTAKLCTLIESVLIMPSLIRDVTD